MKQLMEELKSGMFKNVYLFFGEEQYLVRLYEGKLKQKALNPGQEAMNMTTFEGKAVDLNDVENTLNTLPFMCDRRLVVLRGTGLFAAGKKNESERCAGLVEQVPATTLLLFVETDVDKRLKLYKQVIKSGRAVEFKKPEEKELVNWVRRSLERSGKRISTADAVYMLRMVASDMSAIECETEKLISYLGNRDTATQADIEQVCTKSLDSRIFDMVDAIGNKQPERALDIFNNLLVQKESPIMVVTMIARQFRLILQSKLWAERGLSAAEIAGRIGQRGFVVNVCMKQGRNFTPDSLTQALKDCLDTDMSIKSGRMNDKLAVEILILKYSQ